MPKFKESGKIDTLFLPELVIDLYKQQKSGVLKLNSVSRLDIYFDKGTPFYAEGGDEETLLLKILLDNHKITDEQYREIVARIDKTDMRVGEIIVKMDILNPHELNDFIELQINEKIIRGLTYTKGDYHFEETVDFPPNAFYCRLNLQSIILDTLSRYVDYSEININNMTLNKHDGYSEKVSKLNLGPKELRIAQLLNKNTKLSGILKSENIDHGKLITLVFFLSLYKLLDIKDFSVKDYCYNSFKQLQEQSDSAGEESIMVEDDDTEKIIDLEYEVDEEVGKKEDEGIEIEASQSNDSIGLQQNRASEGEIPGESKGIEINMDSSEEDHDRVPKQNVDEISEEGSWDNQLDIETGEEDKHDVINNQEITMKQQGEYHEGSPGIDPEAESESEEEQNTPGNITEGVTPEQSDEENSKLEEITDFYEFVSGESNSYRILGIEEDSDDAGVKEAYFRLVKKFHPDANPHFPKDIRNKAETIFTKVTQAYESLATKAKRESYNYLQDADQIKDKAQAIYEAEIMYNDGELLLRQRRYKKAAENFARAVELNPDEAAYIGALAWSKFLSYENKNSILKESIKELEKATSINENVAENFYYLGSLYKHANDTSEAEKNFNKAVEIDPHYIQAKRELRLLRNRKNEPAKDTKKEKSKGSESGFWSSLFKK